MIVSKVPHIIIYFMLISTAYGNVSSVYISTLKENIGKKKLFNQILNSKRIQYHFENKTINVNNFMRETDREAKKFSISHEAILDNSEKIIEAGKEILMGEESDATNCKERIECKQEYVNKKCTEARYQGDYNCLEDLSIKVLDNGRVRESWLSQCYPYKNLVPVNLCHERKHKQCTIANKTYRFKNRIIKRECWEKRLYFHCGVSKNSCDIYRRKGCEQIGSICERKIAGQCITYKQIFQCPTNHCEPQKISVSCKSKELFCSDGKCANSKRKANKSENFYRVISQITAAEEAGIQFNGKYIFKGESTYCRQFPLDFSDCCQTKGWGQGIHLTKCKAFEKKLARSKQQGLCVFIGKFCAHKIKTFGKCYQYHKAYCCFGSKLARIIQVNGREQLHKSFGSAKYPHCSGFTVTELEQINFQKIDFSRYYGDLKNKVHLSNSENDRLKIRKSIDHFANEDL